MTERTTADVAAEGARLKRAVWEWVKARALDEADAKHVSGLLRQLLALAPGLATLERLERHRASGGRPSA